ncbi:MAG: sigma-70 family RNA polymerase sigma factor [Crocinitomicaceae bacterium]
MDKKLIDQFRKDPQYGFQLIVQHYQERVYWQIRRLTKNHQDTEDVMQIVFIKVWKGLDDFREASNLYTWIYRIAFNETHTFLKQRSQRSPINMDPPLFETNHSTEGNEISGEKIEALLQQAIATLPEKQRQVFELKYFDELKFKEISELLGTSIGALKASYHLAVKKIEDFIQQL